MVRKIELFQHRGRSGAEDQNTVGQEQGFVHIVGHEQDGGSNFTNEIAQGVLQRHASQRIQSTERFIQQQGFGLRDKSAGQGGTLAHATRHLLSTRILAVLWPTIHVPVRAPALVVPLELQRQRDVLLQRQPWVQRHFPETSRYVQDAWLTYCFPSATTLPRDGRSGRCHMQQGGFATARWPDKCHGSPSSISRLKSSMTEGRRGLLYILKDSFMGAGFVDFALYSFRYMPVKHFLGSLLISLGNKRVTFFCWPRP